jgi:hypothetical protein
MANVAPKASGTPSTSRGSIHGRTKGEAPHLTLAQLFPRTTSLLGVKGKSKGKSKGVTKHAKAGMHGRGTLPVAARKDPWKHKDQAAHQG